jgi:HEAT repeats
MLSGRTILFPVILAASALALAPAGAEEGEPPQRPDAFLVAWVNGTASFDFFTKLHADYPESPHKRDTEEFEVAFKCFFLREECGEDRATSLTRELLKLYRAEPTEADTRRRVLHVLGRIRSAEAVPLLCEVARTGKGDLKEAALVSLGFFGAVPARAAYLVFGGRIRTVVFPAAVSPDATRALLELFRELRAAKPELPRGEVYRPGLFREAKQRLQRMTSAVVRALKSHRGADVAAAVLETLEGTHRVRRTWMWDDLGEILHRSLEHVDAGQLRELLKDERPEIRKAAAYALGWTASAAAVSPLLGLLDDEDRGVREQADDALSRLSGSRPDVRSREERRTAEQWIELLGRKGELLDTEKSLRHEDLKPGVYRIGA